MARQIAEYKEAGTKTIETYEPVIDEEGNATGEMAAVTKEVPVMGIFYRDATDEEEEAFNAVNNSSTDPISDMEDLSEMAYVNSELALALIDMEE